MYTLKIREKKEDEEGEFQFYMFMKINLTQFLNSGFAFLDDVYNLRPRNLIGFLKFNMKKCSFSFMIYVAVKYLTLFFMC